MKVVIDIEKLNNNTLKKVARELGWDANKKDLYDWLEEDMKRFDFQFNRDDWLEFNIEEYMVKMLEDYKDDDIQDSIVNIPDDVMSNQDKEDLIADLKNKRRWDSVEEVWNKIKEHLEDYNDIYNYKWDKREEFYRRERIENPSLKIDDINIIIDNDGCIYPEIK